VKFKNASILSAFLAVSAACSTTPPVETFPVDASPSEEVKKLEADIGTAVSQQVDVLSPENFEEARDALEDAKDSLADKDDARDVLAEVAVGRAYLKAAQGFANVSVENMKDVVDARAAALAAGAKTNFGSEFRKVDEDLRDVAENVEENDLDLLNKKRGDLQARYLELELRGIKRSNLATAEGLVNEAKRKDADKWAPRTLAIAEKSIRDAEAYIIAHRHDTAQIKVMADKALADAQHVVEITGSAKSGNKTTDEEAALRMEAANEAIRAKQAELAQKEALLNTTAAVAVSAQGALAAQQELDKKYADARAMFAENEAEVYRQGKAIVIRLRSLEFDTAEAQLKGSNFPVLAKVQNVIAEFPTSQVTVEGHTDSRGGKAINAKLSKARAEAVKSYFEANSTAEGAKFSAVGYDFQKPLADNKTESGRAQNRRVDIVIEPQSM